MEENVTETENKVQGKILNRSGLEQALDTVYPALSTKEFIPIFTCFCFHDDHFYAYDDLIAIKAKISTGITGGVRGSMFSKLVKGFNSEVLSVSQKENEVRLKADKVSMKMPVVPESGFVFEWPDIKDPALVITFDNDFLDSLSGCLESCAVDTSTPALCGVTLANHDGVHTLNSTDRLMITSSKIATAPGQDIDPIILPTDFCSALIEIARRLEVSGTLRVSQDRKFAIADFDDETYSLFTKLMSCDPIDYKELLDRYSNEEDVYFPVPKELEQMMNRASILMPGENASCRLTIRNNALELNTVSGFGDLYDSVDIDSNHEDIEVFIDPRNIMRASGSHNSAALMTIKERSIAFVHGDKIQLVANKS